MAARRGYPDVALELADRDNDISPRYYDVTAKAEFDRQQAYAQEQNAGLVGALQGVSGAVPKAQAYRGPCASGWVNAAWVRVLAG